MLHFCNHAQYNYSSILNFLLLTIYYYNTQLFPKSRKLAYDSRQSLSQVQNGIKCPSELFLSLDELSRYVCYVSIVLSNIYVILPLTLFIILLCYVSLSYLSHILCYHVLLLTLLQYFALTYNRQLDLMENLAQRETPAQR